MLERAVLPDLLARAGEPTVIASRVLKVWGETESGLNARLDDVISRLDDDGDVTLAFLARGWNGLEIRLTTSAESAAAAEDKLRPWEAEIRGPARQGRVRQRRRLDGVGGRRRPAPARLDARHRRVVDRRTRRRSPGQRAGRQRRAARLARHLRQRRQVRPARRHARPGDQRGGGAWRWPRAPAGCSAPTSGWRSPVSPVPTCKTTSRSARCASPSSATAPTGRRRCAIGHTASRDQIRQLSVINALDLLRRFLR